MKDSMYDTPYKVYVGYDDKEKTYFDVLSYSIRKYATSPVDIIPLKQTNLRRAGLYFRSQYINEDSQFVDCFDDKPFSTEFSFTRFLVPFLNQFEGYALFMDCDMFVKSDIVELFERYCDPKYAVSCVHHDHTPQHHFKMDRRIQSNYFRKNWSSLVLWNCGHEALKDFTVHDVSTKSGSYLHRFGFLEKENEDNLIGSIPEEWNWLDAHSNPKIDAKCVHFTTGGPIYNSWDGKREIDNKYAKEWTILYSEIVKRNG